MLKIGSFQSLIIVREMPQGYYLEDEEGTEVLFPQKYITDEMSIGDSIEVFVYCDTDDVEVATTEQPVFTVGQYAALEVMDQSDIGAFCDWGVIKQLFVPFSLQARKMDIGETHVVHMYLDEVTDRLVGTTKLDGYLTKFADEELKVGQEVDILVYNETEIGYKVVVNQKYAGLIYKNEAPERLLSGQALKGYIKPIREDKKIDISLDPIGVVNIEPNAKKIYDKLISSEGFLPFTDKSDPDKIRAEFGISKKLFKKSLGALYRQKLVLLKENGIYKA